MLFIFLNSQKQHLQAEAHRGLRDQKITATGKNVQKNIPTL